MSKRILCLIQQPPYGSHKGHSHLDATMMLAALGHDVSLAFVSDGVWHLVSHQQPEQLPMKPYTKALKALDIYDIQHVYAVTEDLAQRHLKEINLFITPYFVDRSRLRHIMDEQDFIFTV